MKSPRIETAALATLLVLALLLAWVVSRSSRPESESNQPIPVLARALPVSRPGIAAPTPVVHEADRRATAPVSGPAPVHTRLAAFGEGWNQPIPEPEFERFAGWANRYLSAAPDARRAAEAEGIHLAAERRAALRGLIQADPERALALTVPERVRRELPAAITALLEERISGRGNLDVLAALAEPGRENEVTPTFRVVSLNGREYDAFVYGRRLGEPTRKDIALNGVAVDKLLAVNENPVRVLSSEEAAAVLAQNRGTTDPVCAISGQSSTLHQTQTVADVAGKPIFLCGVGHAEDLNAQIIQAEVAANVGGGGGEVAGSTRTEGMKKLLLIRVDFSDLAGAPFNDATGTGLISGLNSFYAESSFGRTGFYLQGSGSDVTPTLRMPQAAGVYGPNNSYTQLRSDARAAATAAGYNLAAYDYDIVCFGAVPGWGWAGLGYVGAAGVWLRSYFTPGVAGHELGHNYGLNHANFWDTGGQSVIGAGSSVEYGDVFDTMGSANAGANHFNASYKSYLNWLTPADTLTVSTSGVYRIYPHDDTNSTGLRGLKIVRSSSTNYWVEFRQKFTSNKWLMSGASIRWSGNGNERSHLLDTTPGSPDGKNDSAVVLGRTFSDSVAGIHITTLRKGGTTPESLDVAVNLGTFPGNNAPQVTITPNNTTTSSGAAVLLSASATDGDGDTLAYYWDFGDATFGTNGTLASKTWNTAGEYVVRCVVSDMKGGVGSDSVVIRVDNPGAYRISGQVTAGGLPVQGARVSVSTVKMTYTDSDGGYVLAGLPAGTYTVSAALNGYSFIPSGFANPVPVGPSVTGINFDQTGSGNAVLTSPQANAVYSVPANVFLAASATAASGESVVRVEFYEGATKLGEDTTFPYSFTWASPAAGSYSLTARSIDTAGALAISAPVAITVSPAAPSITAQPQSQNVTAGGTATFSVTAAGSAPLAYQWRYNGADLVGITTPTLSLFNVQPTEAGAYRVVVSNGSGSITSAVANLTVSCAFILSSNSAVLPAAGGSRVVDVTTAGGCSWSVGNVPAWITIVSGGTGSGNGTVLYSVATNSGASTRSATLSIAGHNFIVSQQAPDLTRPTVAFSSPSAGAVVTNGTVTIAGTSDDDAAVAQVEWRLGGGAFVAATGTASWSAQVNLVPGTNWIGVRSVDLSGNVSATNTRAVFCAVPGTLSLVIRGQGAVSGVTNGQHLQIGRPYTIRAMPEPGCVFSNWSGDLSGEAPTLTFLMESNLLVSANFVPNPFAAVKGSYGGLFHETNEVQLGSSGAFLFKLGEKGSYTAALRIGTRRHTTSGKLNLTGTATNHIARKGTNALTITWAVDTGGADQISGTVSDGIWTAALLGDRAVFHSTNPPPQLGRYTLAIEGSPGSALAPGGDSIGTASVNKTGTVTVLLSLADGLPVVGRYALSKSGQWPLHAPVHGGTGVLLGWVAFEDQASTDCDGVISWIQLARPDARYYPAGFSSQAALLGSHYLPPTNSTDLLLGLTDGLAIFSGGNLPDPSTNSISVGPGNHVTHTGTNALSMAFATSSGRFAGRFQTPALPKKTSFRGVVLQKAGRGTGYFLGTNESGQVAIEPAP